MKKYNKKILDAILAAGGNDEDVAHLETLLPQIASLVIATRQVQPAPPSLPKYMVVRDKKSGYDTITVKVLVERSLTSRAMLDATSRSVLFNDTSVASMPLVGDKDEEEVEFVWFWPKRILYSPEVEAERVHLGLVPDIQAQVQANADDPFFADTHPNWDSWQDADKKWHCIDFNRNDSVGRCVHCIEGILRLDSDYWFGGIRKSLAA